jgi:hypothetical protein
MVLKVIDKVYVDTFAPLLIVNVLVNVFPLLSKTVYVCEPGHNDVLLGITLYKPLSNEY